MESVLSSRQGPEVEEKEDCPVALVVDLQQVLRLLELLMDRCKILELRFPKFRTVLILDKYDFFCK